MKTIAQWLSTRTLICLGLIGVAISALDLFGIDPQGIVTKETASISLLILGLLASAFGIERATTGRDHAAALKAIELRLSQLPVAARRVEGNAAIYEEGIRLVSRTDRRIRSIVVGTANKAPIEFVEAVRSRLTELDRSGKPARFDSVADSQRISD